MSGRLDRWTATGSIGLAIGLVVLTTGTAAVFVSDGLKGALGVGDKATRVGYRVGERIDITLPAQKEGRQLVLFVRSTCSACETARPILRELVEAATAKRIPVTLVVPADAAAAGEFAYAKSLGVSDGQVLWKAATDVRVKIVPAVVITDGAGRILFAKEGAFGDTDAAALIRWLGDGIP